MPTSGKQGMVAKAVPKVPSSAKFLQAVPEVAVPKAVAKAVPVNYLALL